MSKIFSLHNIIIRMGLFIALGLLIAGCTKFVQIETPPNQLLSSSVFSSDITAASAVTGIYARMTSANGFASGGGNSVTVLSGLSADEFLNYITGSNDPIEFVTNNLTPTNGIVSAALWADAYQYIFTTNSIIEGLNASTGVSSDVKKQLLGESRFMRAFCYFYLTSLFGDVPLDTTSAYQVNAISERTSSTLVYNQIISDLKNAQVLLSPNYSVSNGERVRPNQAAATALLARVYLFMNDWSDAEEQATAVINNTSYYSLPSDLDSVFLANSSEAIWQLLPVRTDINTQEGQIFILTADPLTVSMTSSLTNSFEPGDERYSHWVGTFSDGGNTWYFPYKYKVQASPVLTEYSMVLRLAEQYLIRSEARARLNNISGAQDDLNIIRARAGLPNTAANDQASLLSALLHERQTELFSEWGHRWLDLKRTNMSTSILGPIKGATWQSTDTLYPIPQTEISANSRITQNPGY